MKKRLMAVLLALVMVLSIVPAASAAEVDSGTCGENLTWTLDDSGTLTISGTGEMTDFNYVYSPWYGQPENILAVVIEDGVTSIGDQAFRSCYSLTSVTIPDSVTTIGNGAFVGCYGLADENGFVIVHDILFDYYGDGGDVVIPDSVTSIRGSAFRDCESLTSVTIPDSVTSIGDAAFLGCEGLADENGFVIVHDILFDYYGDGGTVVIPDSVTSISSSAFYWCDSLTSITIPDSVTSIGYEAFYGCDSLTSVTIPDSVTSIGGGAFEYCDSLTSVTIPDSVTSIGYEAFSGCYGLADENGFVIVDDILLYYYGDGGDIVIPDSVTSIGNWAFDGCDSLTSVAIPDSVTSIGDYAFQDCDSLTSVAIPDSVTSIGNYAFDYCRSLTSVAIPDSVTSIGDNAFHLCDSLTSVTIPDSVTSIGERAFCFCYSLTSVTIPDSVTSIGDSAFFWCDSLTDVTIPDSVTSIGDDAFRMCESLTSINVDSGNSVYSSMDGVLLNKDGTTLIQCPGGKSGAYSIPDSVTSIEDYAFYECTSLTSVTIPDSVTSIGDWAFEDCDSLTSITIPDSVTSIGRYAFLDCDSLTSVTIPDSVTSIGFSAFGYCDSLTEIVFHGDAPIIEGDCFYNISATAYYPSNNATWTDNVMQDYGGTITWVPYTPEPEPTEPTPTEPKPTEPTPTEPKPTEPTPTEPKPTEPEPTAPAVEFTDVGQDQWFYDTVQWAVDNGITNGTTATTFAPDSTCTRNQVVTFLWRAEGEPEPTSANNPFTDVKESDYFYKAVLWAVENGITNGMDATHFDPNGKCTRGQVVTFLHRAAGKPAPKSTDNPFTDVGQDYYTDAVLWAVGEGITDGMTPTTFEPNTTCTRAQIVTFLNRAYT